MNKKSIEPIKVGTNAGDTLKILGQVYAWMGIGCAIYLCFIDIVNFGLLVKMLIVLAFLYNKNNWRMLVLVMSAITVIYSIFTIDSILSVFDIAGFSIIFWYALKYRK